MPGTGRLGPQRHADHIHTVSPPQQARHRQQHMRHQTRTAPGTTWAKITDTADRALPGMPPRAQATAARADQLAGQQTPFDLECIATYHDHGCPPTHQATAPSRPPKEWRGPLRLPERDQAVVAHKKGPPEGCPCDHHRDQRRSTTATSSGVVSFNTCRPVVVSIPTVVPSSTAAPRGRVTSRATGPSRLPWTAPVPATGSCPPRAVFTVTAHLPHRSTVARPASPTSPVSRPPRWPRPPTAADTGSSRPPRVCTPTEMQAMPAAECRSPESEFPVNNSAFPISWMRSVDPPDYIGRVRFL